MKKLLVLALLAPALAIAQTYPSPTFNSVTLQNPLTAANGGTGVTAFGTGVASALGNNVTGTGGIVLATSPSIANPTITGALTATGLVTTSDLAAQAANTVLANVTGSSASPTAFAVGGCSTSASALTWVSGTGFTCNTSINAAALGGATFASPGAIGSGSPSTGAFTSLSSTTSNPSLNYLSPGTGASTRSYASKFEDTISVMDFLSAAQIADVRTNAQTLDSTTAIQAAINYAESLPTGGKIYFPPGTYLISSPLLITGSNITLEGAVEGWYGQGGSTIRTTAAATDIIDIVGTGPTSEVFNDTVQYLLLQYGYQGAADDTNTGGSGILFKYTAHGQANNVTVVGMGSGVTLYSANNTYVFNSYFERIWNVPSGSTAYGIHLTDNGTNLNASNTFRDIIIVFPVGVGGYPGTAYGALYGGVSIQDTYFEGVEIDGATIGMSFALSSPSLQYDVKIDKCVIDSFYQYGISISGFTQAGGIDINGGWMASTFYSSGTTLAGVFVNGSAGVKVSGVEIYGGNRLSDTTQYGILAESCNNCTFTGNRINSVHTGIGAISTTNSIFSNNQYGAWQSTSQLYGIVLNTNSNNNILNGNYIDNGGNTLNTGILLEGNSTNNQITGNQFNTTGTFTNGHIWDITSGNTNLTYTPGVSPTYPVGIIGNKTGSAVSAGSVGEVLPSNVPVGSAVSVSSATPANITSINLTAGDWDVWGTVCSNPASGTVQQFLLGWFNTISATNPGAPNGGGFAQSAISAVANAPVCIPVGMKQYNVSGPTTVYLSVQSNFTVSTMSVYGFIGARRR